MIGELTAKIKIQAGPMTVTEALRQPRLVRKQLEVPLVMQGSDPLLVGRDESVANLIIKDSFISRTHAAIFRKGGQYFVQDLHSKNGTYLNGNRLDCNDEPAGPLQDGDRIRFNVVEFQFVIPKENPELHQNP